MLVSGMMEFYEFRIIDRNSEAAGVPVSRLMDNAGSVIARSIETYFPERTSVVFICGPGNNGGDGMTAALKVSAFRETVVVPASPDMAPKSEMLRQRYAAVSKLSSSLDVLDRIPPERLLIVDCLLGYGVDRPPEGRFLELIEMMNSLRKKGAAVLAIDVPSGFPYPRHVLPDMTITFVDMKKGMDEESCGKVVVGDIGIPETALNYTGPGDMLLYPVPSAESHKGNNGIVTVIGGSIFPGAPVFSSLAAYRTGADLVYTVVPSRMAGTVSSFSPNIMAFGFNEGELSEKTLNSIIHWIDRSNAVVIGPGTTYDSFNSVAETLITRTDKPMVIDASAIETVGRRKDLLRGKKAVITPHAVEFLKLTGEMPGNSLEERKEKVQKWSAKIGATILLKGRIDIVSDGTRIKLNSTGNPGMTVGGTGDVLTGVVAALMSKGLDPFNSARLGAYINGSAGDICFREKSYGLLSTDLIEAIPEVIRNSLS